MHGQPTEQITKKSLMLAKYKFVYRKTFVLAKILFLKKTGVCVVM
jgi:hypothetical protein